MRLRFGDGLEVAMLDKGHMALRHRNDAMIHGLEQERMQIDKIAGNVQGGDLARAIGQEFVARRKAVD